MTIASSCGWWTLSASSSMNVMAYSSVTLILRNRPKSWTFCTTFRYVFLNLEDCPIEVPLMMTLISPSGGCDGSSSFPFNFSALWSYPRKFLNFPCLMRFSIYYFKSKHSSVSCPWSLWKRQYLFLLCLLGISLHLHKYLFKQHVQGRVLLTPCWKACLLVVSIFLLSRPCFFGWGPYSRWHGRSTFIHSTLFLFLVIIASSAFMKFCVEWTSSAMVWGSCL